MAVNYSIKKNAGIYAESKKNTNIAVRKIMDFKDTKRWN